MKICIVAPEYPPKVVSGPGRYAINLVNRLKKDSGNEITVVTPLNGDEKRYEKNENVEIYRIKINRAASKVFDRRFLFNFSLKKFFENFEMDRYDVLHILDMHNSYFLNDRIRKKTRVIISANDYYALETSWNILDFPYFCTDLPLRYMHYNMNKVLTSKSLKKADLIISDTKYTAKVINKVAKIPNEKIKVVYKGVDTEKFLKQGRKNKYKSCEVLYIGGNMERKGVKDLVKAMPIVLESFPKAKLTIIGNASRLYKYQLKNLIKKNKLNGTIKYFESYPSDKITGLYEKANIFVLPAIIEDLAQVLMEAMATSTPVVATNVGANPEGPNEKTGILIEPKNPKQIAEAIIKIFSNPNLAEKMGAEGRRRVEEIFNSERMLKETAGVYNG